MNNTKNIELILLVVGAIIALITLFVNLGQWLVPLSDTDDSERKEKFRQFLSFLTKVSIPLVFIIFLIWGLLVFGVLDPLIKPSIKVKNNLALPVSVYIEKFYRGDVDAYSTKTLFLGSYPANVSFEIKKLTTRNNSPIGDDMSGFWNSVGRGDKLQINSDMNQNMYFYPVINNETSKECSVTVNEGLKSENETRAVVEGNKSVGLGYYALASNSNVTLHCDDGSVFWWGSKSGKESSETPLHLLIEEGDGVLNLTFTE